MWKFYSWGIKIHDHSTFSSDVNAEQHEPVLTFTDEYIMDFDSS